MHSISAIGLVREFDSNEVAAEQKYKGQLTEITGTIESIEKSMMGDYYVSLKTGMSTYSVTCYFEDPKVLAKLKSGQYATIVGVLDSIAAYQLSFQKCELK